MILQRPLAEEYNPYYLRYIEQVGSSIHVPRTLLENFDDTEKAVLRLPGEASEYRRRPDSWTLRQALIHCCDTERVMSYRALSIARGDTTPLPGYDQDAWAEKTASDARSLPEVMREWRSVRLATTSLFESFSERQWMRHGTANGGPVSARALAWIVAGHELHHRTLIEDFRKI